MTPKIPWNPSPREPAFAIVASFLGFFVRIANFEEFFREKEHRYVFSYPHFKFRLEKIGVEYFLRKLSLQ